VVERASRRVSGESLAVLRIAIGLVVVLSAIRTVAYGWTDRLYADPTHRFTYLWLGWVPQPGHTGIRVLVAITAAAGLALALGWRTRAAAAALLVSFGWIELIDASTYLNHYVFVTLLALLALVVPFGATWSLDARRRGSSDRRIATGWVWLLRFQVGVVYASAGLAKLQPDWLLRGLPLRYWLPARADVPLIGPLLRYPETAHVLSVAGAAFDCAVVPLLLWRRTRLWAWLAVVAFHLITWRLFPIGVFPWLMIAMATVFFDPGWPGALWRRLRPSAAPEAVAADGAGRAPLEPLGAPVPTWRRRLLAAAAGVWVVVQLALPLRHFAYPGDHRWTGEGYRFGWNVLLVERMASVTFLVSEPSTGRTWTFDPSDLYTDNQLRVMRGEPDLILEAAHAIAAHEAAQGRHVEVHVDAWLSFNGRPAQRWIDPDVDLAAEPSSPWHKTWILSPS
jgi:hypothetical protein